MQQRAGSILVGACVALLSRSAAAKEAPETDLWTVLGIGVTTYFSASMIHEGLGHEGACAIAGGNPNAFSTGVAGCAGDLSAGGERIVAAGGAAANLVVAGGAFGALAIAPPSSGPEYYFLWLTGTVNLYQTAGYLMVGPWFGVGDFGSGAFLKDLQPRLPWQIGLSTAGLAMTFGTLFLSNALAEPLLGGERQTREDRQWTLTLWPYLVGASLITASGALSRLGPEVAISAGAANFAGTLFLAYVPLFFSSDFFYPAVDDSPDRAMPMPRSTPWLVAGAASVILAMGVFGPGVGNFHQPHPLDPS